MVASEPDNIHREVLRNCQRSRQYVVIAVMCILCGAGLVKVRTTNLLYDDPTWTRKFNSTCGDPLSRIALTNITWIHPPKTGTSAANIIYRYACSIPNHDRKRVRLPHIYLKKTYPPEKFCTKLLSKTQHRFGLHDPAWFDKNLVVSLRENSDRLWSSFTHALKNPAWGRTYGCFISKELVPDIKIKETLPNIPKLFRAYVNSPKVRDCQTKMLVGRECCHGELVTRGEYETAAKRLQAAAHIFLTGEWKRSVCLFALQYGGKIRRIAFHNTRPTLTLHHPLNRFKRAAITLASSTMQSHYDNALLILAKDIISAHQMLSCCNNSLSQAAKRPESALQLAELGGDQADRVLWDAAVRRMPRPQRRGQALPPSQWRKARRHARRHSRVGAKGLRRTLY